MIEKWEKERAGKEMEKDLLWLLEQRKGMYQWIGTKRDLVEMTHCVWLRDVVFDPMGRVLPFIHLLHRVCCIVDVPMPKKPTAMLDTISHRKNQELLSMTCRYVRIMRELQRDENRQLTLFPKDRPIKRFLAVRAKVAA